MNEESIEFEQKRAIQELVSGDKRTPFESEAESSILRALENKESDGDASEINSRRATRANKASRMIARASMVRPLPPVLEEGSTKTSFGLTSDSSLLVYNPPKLKDIAQRIRMIQKVSYERRTSTIRQRPPYDFSGERPVSSGPQTESSTRRLSADGDYDHEAFDANDMIPDTLNTSNRHRDLYSTFLYFFSRVVHFLKARRPAMEYFVRITFYFFVPMIGVAVCLFHIGNNPIGPLGASYSWWIIFTIRQFLTFMLAQLAQFILIDIIVLQTKLALMVFGRVITLIAMQAKGWPTLILAWTAYDYFLLFGPQKYIQHWLYWQNSLGMFNETNPSGTVTINAWYGSLLITLGLCSFLTMIKRVLVAILLGRKKYGTFSNMYFGKKLFRLL